MVDSDAISRYDLKKPILRYFAFPLLLLSFFIGIWLGLWKTYGDIDPSWDRIEFALIITVLPFLCPLITNLISIQLINKCPKNRAGSILLASSLIMAILVGIFVVPMGNF
jgi:hypothetical protein